MSAPGARAVRAAAAYSLDTNCMVAAAISGHSHHQPTARAIEALERDGARPIVIGHTVLEAYSVLTRLPDRMRLDPATAYAVLFESWSDCATATPVAADIWRLVQTAAQTGLSGSRVHDAAIAETARTAGVEVLLTWNTRHFERWPMGGTHVRTPAEVLAGA